MKQSGLVTPGHHAVWVTDEVVADGGPLAAAAKVLVSLRNADFNTTSDQPILLPPPIQSFQLTGIIVTNASRPLNNAQGGFYTAASKGGTAIVAAGQSYSALATADDLLNLTLAALTATTRFSLNNLAQTPNIANLLSLELFFSLTVAQGSDASADIYLLGIDLT